MITPSPPQDEFPPLSPREEELVRGTYRVMARIGSQQTSLRIVARELDVSPALLVYHFGTKDNLLLSTMRWALHQTVDRIGSRLEEVDDAEHALDVLLDAVFDDAIANRDYYLVYLDLLEYTVRNPSFNGLTDLVWKYVNGSYAVVIQHGVAAGLFDTDDIEASARQMRAVIDGTVVQWLQDKDWKARHAHLAAECRQMLDAVLAPPPAARRRVTKAKGRRTTPTRARR
jgi:AcrR family transcriptional regulator